MSLSSGLNLLAPTLEALERRYDALALQLQTLSDTVARKAEGSVVDDINLRLQDVTSIVAEKAEFCEVEQINSHLQALSTAVAGKAAQSNYDSLKSQFDGLSLSLKADASKLTDLEVRLEGQLKQKVEFQEVETLYSEVQAMKLLMASKASTESLDNLNAKLRETDNLVASLKELKADAVGIEQLHANYRAVNTALANKAEWAEVNQLKAQVQSATLHLPKAQADELERLAKQIHALSSTVTTVSATPPFVELANVQRRLDELNDAVVRKADQSVVSEFSNQLQAQYNALSGYIANHAPRAVVTTRVRSPQSTVSSPLAANPWSSSPTLSGSLRPRSATGRNRLKPSA